MGSNDGDNTLLVLHIDDDESFLEMTKLYLGRYFNFHVDTTTSPKNAISLLSDRSYDAVISDYQMPGMDGISLLKKIRHDLGMDVPFTLFTGKGREVIAMEALNLGANHYLQKGGDPKSMFAVLAETIIQEVNHNKTKKLVEANERKYRSIFESAKDAIFIMKDDKFIDCNNRTLELFNCSREEIIGVSPDKVSPKIQHDGRKSKEKSLVKIKAALNGAPQTFEWTHMTMDGTPFFTEVSLNKYTTDDDYIMAIVRDITEKKRNQEKLRENQELYRYFFKDSPYAVFITSEDGQLIDFNDMALKIFGYDSAEDLYKINVSQLYVNPEDRQTIMSLVKKHGSVRDAPLKFIRNDGSEIDALITASCIVDHESQGGKSVKYVGIVKDITHQKKTEFKLNQRIKELSCLYFISSILNDKGLSIDEMYKKIVNFIPQSLQYDNIACCKISIDDKVFVSDNCGEPEWTLPIQIMTNNGPNGLITVGYDEKRPKLDFGPFSKEEKKFLDAVAELISEFTKRMDYERKIDSLYSLLLSIRDVNQLIVKENDQFRLMQKACDILKKTRDYENIEIALFDNASNDIRLVASAGELEMAKWEMNEKGEGTAPTCYKRCIEEERPIIMKRHRKECNKCIYGNENIKLKRITVPIRENGDVVGFLSALLLSRHYISEDEVRLLEEVAGDLGNALQKIHTEEGLADRENEYSTILQNINDAIIMFDIGGRIKVWNDEATEMFGYSIEEVIESKVQDIIIPKRHVKKYLASISKFKRKREVPWDGKNVELEALRKDGSVFPIEATFTFLEMRKEPYLVIVARDISARKDISEALRNTNKKLHLLTSITRHNVSNKLTAAMNLLELVLEGNDNKNDADCLKRALSALGDIQNNIRFTGEYEKLGMDRPVWLDIKEQVGKIDDAAIPIDCRCEGVSILTDPLAKKVFDNLYENTVLHSNGATKIQVCCKKKDDCLIIRWEDNGIGIPDEEKELIFERGHGKNTGFGLFLAREILEMTGIRIEEKGVCGTGALFEIIVPNNDYKIEEDGQTPKAVKTRP